MKQAGRCYQHLSALTITFLLTQEPIMAKADSIAPFPADIDRDAFGHWLSGLTDGEGCFMLVCHLRKRRHSVARMQPSARFQIQLRDDELPILRKIQSYFGCGNIHTYVTKKGTHPIGSFESRSIVELIQVIVPHFLRYPLRAKKARDFAIWKEGVTLLASKICDSTFSVVTPRNTRRGRSRWDAGSVEQFKAFHDSLRLQRSYQSPVITTAPAREQPGLWW